MRELDTSAFAVCWTWNNDSFNLFHPLPEASLDGGTHHPIHCGGIDFSYDLAKSKHCVATQFHQAYLGDDTSLRDHLHFNLPPLDDPQDKGGSSDSASESSTNTDVEIEDGQTIGSCTVVCLKFDI
jgi:hypothetical protein